MSISSYADALAYLAKGRNKSNRPAPSGNARRIVRDFVAPGTVSVVYHQTPVVTYWADGMVKLYADGWATRTTVDVMSTYVKRDGFTLRISVRNGDAHGRGDGFTFSGREDGWPREPARVRKCRGCSGTGTAKRGWHAGQRCWGCAGTGERDYGSAIVPIELDAHDCLEILADGTMTPDDSSSFPSYPCKCKMCGGGFSSWQEMHAAGTWALASGATVPAMSGDSYSRSGDVLAGVLPGLSTRVTCPACTSVALRPTVRDAVIHLNDSHRWTREAIADWLDTLDADLAFPMPETSNAV